jgi:hypothetical protein
MRFGVSSGPERNEEHKIVEKVGLPEICGETSRAGDNREAGEETAGSD